MTLTNAVSAGASNLSFTRSLYAAAELDAPSEAKASPVSLLAARCLDRREKVIARVLAAATGFGAKPAVLVVGGVPVALLGTGEAGDAAGFDHCAG